jgi:tRNA (cytidine56-2'-O)-methyltransferase
VIIMAVTVLRLGHRPGRDKRISTHVGLVARALGADNLFYSGLRDSSMESSIQGVVRQWGGPFGVSHVRDWKSLIKEWKGRSVHLTMYGMPVQKRIVRIRKENDLLVVVGGEKVPWEVFELADWNVGVTNQPHSEVGALAIFLHEYFQGRELSLRFRDARRRVVPQARGKKVDGKI